MANYPLSEERLAGYSSLFEVPSPVQHGRVSMVECWGKSNGTFSWKLAVAWEDFCPLGLWPQTVVEASSEDCLEKLLCLSWCCLSLQTHFNSHTHLSSPKNSFKVIPEVLAWAELFLPPLCHFSAGSLDVLHKERQIEVPHFTGI